MPVLGIGTDIESVARIAKSMERNTFIDRVFTKNEQEYFKHKKNYAENGAGIFCAKEALFKALGTGISFSFLDMEVCHRESGAPHFLFYGKLSEKIQSEELKVFLSISHTKDYATANVIIECKGERPV